MSGPAPLPAGRLLMAWLLMAALTGAGGADDPGVPAGMSAQTVAVAPFEVVFTDGTMPAAGQAVGRAMEDALQGQLAEAPALTVVERASIDQVLREQSLALAGLIDPSTAARIGMLLRADVMVVGRIRSLDAALRLATLRAVSTADAHVLWCGEAQGDDAALAGQAASLGADLMGALRQRPSAGLAASALPLMAAKHHERAIALHALGANAEAASEEALALRAEPGQAASEADFLAALSDAGFGALAAAQARADLAARAAGADEARLRALAAQTGMPVPARHEEAPDSMAASGLRRFIDVLGRRASEARADQRPALQRDEVRAWILLGNAYVAEQLDHRARAAYHEALTRLWSLRASDARTVMEADFAFPKICASAAARAIEMAARHQYSSTGEPLFDPLLAWTVRTASAAKQGLPAGAREAQAVYRCELPIIDRLLLPSPGHPGCCNFLFRLDLRAVPAGSAIAHACISGLQRGANDGGFAQLPTRFVGAEANLVFARAGVPWPAQGPFGNDQALGRTPFQVAAGEPGHLLDCLRAALRRGAQECDLVLIDAMGTRPAQLPEVHVRIDLAVAPGQAGGLVPCVQSRISAGVYRLLSGDAAAARREFAAVEADDQQARSAAALPLARELLGLCGEAP